MYKIAEAYNISQVSVRTIVDNYIVYCRGRLASGGRVDFFGLAYITPEFEYLRLNITLAYECKLVADKIGLLISMYTNIATNCITITNI